MILKILGGGLFYTKCLTKCDFCGKEKVKIANLNNKVCFFNHICYIKYKLSTKNPKLKQCLNQTIAIPINATLDDIKHFYDKDC